MASIPGREDIYLAQNLAVTVELLSTSDLVLDRVVNIVEELSVSMEMLKQAIRVTGEDGTAFLRLTLSWEEPQQAILLLNGLMQVLPDIMHWFSQCYRYGPLSRDGYKKFHEIYSDRGANRTDVRMYPGRGLLHICAKDTGR